MFDHLPAHLRDPLARRPSKLMTDVEITFGVPPNRQFPIFKRNDPNIISDVFHFSEKNPTNRRFTIVKEFTSAFRVSVSMMGGFVNYVRIGISWISLKGSQTADGSVWSLLVERRPNFLCPFFISLFF